MALYKFILMLDTLNKTIMTFSDICCKISSMYKWQPMVLFLFVFLASCSAQQTVDETRVEVKTVQQSERAIDFSKVVNELTEFQEYVLFEQGTERAFTGEYDKFYEAGVYQCAACNHEIYSSETKYNSGSGWPAFWAPVEGGVEFTKDTSHGMVRTEVHCDNCGGHLGHVFKDGPRDQTGERHCINSASMKFVPSES